MNQGTASGPMRPTIPYSKTRIAGMALYWSWIFIMFNSIQPYAYLQDKRHALYLGLLISLLAAVAMLAFLALESKNGSSWRDNRPVMFISVAAMTVGAIVTPFCDTSTSTGMLILGIASIMTGSGSTPLLVCWCEAQAPLGGRATLCEVALAFLTAFLISLVLAIAPAMVAIIATVITPGASLALLLKSPVNQFLPKSSAAPAPVADDAPTAAQAFPPVKLSAETKRLFAKGLLGALLIGGLAGFFDVFTGFSTFHVEDSYGLFLFIAGSLGFLLLSVLVWKFPRDNVFIAFRLSMLLMCLGLLAAPFLATTLGISSIVFAGYNCYCAVMLAVSADVSRSFRINRSRCVATAFAVLYLGEALGEGLSHGMQSLIEGVPNLAFITLIAVSLLFISSLFLFTEVDLIKIGIGEVDLTVTNPRSLRKGEAGLPNAEATADTTATRPASAADPSPAPAAAPEPQPDPIAIIIERFHLSPREGEVLPLLLEGRTISRIQETLFISQGTVSTHIRHIYQKTGSANRQELIDLSLAILDEKTARSTAE